MGIEIRGGRIDGIKVLADATEFLENRAQQLLRGGGWGVEHLHRDLLDAQHVTGEARHLVGVKQQRILLIAPVLRIELATIKGRVEVARIRVGIAVHRGTGAVQGFLNILDPDQPFGSAVVGLARDQDLSPTDSLGRSKRCRGTDLTWMQRTWVREHETAFGRTGMEPEVSRADGVPPFA
jgi:hypothetical protein